MITCAIIDDEPPAIEILEKHVQNVSFLQWMGSYDNALKASVELSAKPVELIFLDIQMPELTGIQLAKLFQGKSKMIFTTAYSNYALHGYEYDVVDYLMKPISFERFLKACQKALPQTTSISSNETVGDYFFVKSQGKIIKINLGEVIYLEASGNYVSIFTLNDRIVVHCSLSELDEKLPSTRFIRVHKSFVIATGYIKTVEGNEVVLKRNASEFRVPIGEVFKTAFFNQLNLKMMN